MIDSEGQEDPEGRRERVMHSMRWCPALYSSLCLSRPTLAGRSTVCIVLTEEATEDSNVRMNKVRKTKIWDRKTGI